MHTTNRFRGFMLAIALLAMIVAIGFSVASENKVDYPEGYRGWLHVKSMVLQEGHPLYDAFGGIHHIYANAPAAKALKEGGTFPDGAVLVFDLLEANAADNAISEGGRKVVGVMQKDQKKFAATGGWGYEGFKGDSRARVVTDAQASCHSCHMSQKENDYVFSTYRK